MFCGEQSLVGIGRFDALCIPLRCRRWTCEECFPSRLRELRNIAADGDPTTLITLTVDPDKFESPSAAAKALSVAWRNIRQRAKRDGYSDKIPFLAVFEETQRGWPHLHILAQCPFIPQSWLSQRCYEYLRSPIVDIRRVRSRRQASRYVAKYVSKSPHRFDGVKRYWRSRDYNDETLHAKPVADSSRTWILCGGSINDLRILAQCQGWHLNDDEARMLSVDLSDPTPIPVRWLRLMDSDGINSDQYRPPHKLRRTSQGAHRA